MLDRLEKAGYIRREANPRDRRSLFIRPVPAKMRKLHKIYRSKSQSLAEALSPYTDRELELILDFVTRTVAQAIDGFSGCVSRVKPRPSAESREKVAAVSRRATRRSNSLQSSGRWQRKSRIEGYQGVVSPSSIHRQSAANGNSVQTGRPMAAAKWTVELSTESTRSRAAILAAKSSRSTSGSQSVASSSAMPNRRRGSHGVGRGRAVLQIDEPHAGHFKDRLPQFQRDRPPPPGLEVLTTLPGNSDFERAAESGKRGPPFRDLVRIHGKKARPTWKILDALPQESRQRADVLDDVHVANRGQGPGRCRLCKRRDLRKGSGKQRHQTMIAFNKHSGSVLRAGPASQIRKTRRKHHLIADPLLGQDKDRASVKRFSIPSARGRDKSHIGLDGEATFVGVPPFLKLATH